ncbi:beta-ketoacyl-ACP synthase III [Succinimonas sp.]|uniref:beta-ketoacyl-ACP synthase III n=1 Tax=Succinimonas sp. TaxID=1936151 RepID=UPI0038652417
MYSRISGTGSFLPARVRTNADLEKMVETSDEWITERTGIKERRIAEEGDSAPVMAARAAEKALEAAGITAADVDLIVAGTTSSQYAFPSVACDVQRILGASGQPAFDVAAACSGFSFAMSIADAYIRSGSVKRALVIGVDSLSRACDPEDRTTIILFGDGASACILEASQDPGVYSCEIHSDGNHAELLMLPNVDRVTREPAWMLMKGHEVFKYAVKTLSSLVTDTLDKNGFSKGDLDWLVPHQANFRIITATAKRLDLEMSQVIVNLDKYGNTSGASVGIALDEGIRSGKIQRGDLLLLESFGGGFTWGSALVRY